MTNMLTDPMLQRRHFLATVGAIAASPVFAQGGPRQYAAVKALAERYVAEKKLAGLSFALSTGGAPASYVNAGTLAFDSAARVDENSLYRIYSMTKPVTGVAAALLIEDGKLKLDQSIGDILPSWRNPRVAIDPAKGLESRAAAGPVTVRHLLTHTSGVSYTISGKGPVQQEYLRAGLFSTTGVPREFRAQEAQGMGLAPDAVGNYLPNLRAFADTLATMPLIADPGRVWHYSLGLDLLGAVIEAAAGMPFDSFLKTRIFDPLDMASTSFKSIDPRRLTSNYMMSPKGPMLVDNALRGAFNETPPIPMGGAGLVSSARDYFRFGDMLRGGGAIGTQRIMKPETAQMIVSDIMPAGVRYRDGGGFGFGGRVVTADTKEANDSLGSYGWGGAAGTIFWMDPVRRAVVVGMIQILPGEAYPLRKELREALMTDAA